MGCDQLVAPPGQSTGSMIGTALEYFRQGLASIPVPHGTKATDVPWRSYQSQAPSEDELTMMFADREGDNIAIICGEASGNLAVIDAETKPAFGRIIDEIERSDIDTWIVETARGGHIYLRTPLAVRPLKSTDFELRGQGQYVLAPPSIHPSGVTYTFLNKPAEIWRSSSMDVLEWLPLKPALTRRIPRSALRLLRGAPHTYASASEAEQAIITILVNAGFGFEEILRLFCRLPAAGKFAKLRQEDPPNATRWLNLGFEKARVFCSRESPARRRTREALDWAANRPWPGRKGSVDRAVFIAHATLAWRAGHDPYQASSRELAENAGCQKLTASRATNRLVRTGMIERKSSSTSTSAPWYSLKSRLTEREHVDTFPHLNYVGECINDSPAPMPDAFREMGLGRSGFEIWTALHKRSMTAIELAAQTGRHIKTVRKTLRRMESISRWRGDEVLSLVVRDGIHWKPVENVDLDAIARTLGTYGAREKQELRHREQRLNNRRLLKAKSWSGSSSRYCPSRIQD